MQEFGDLGLVVLDFTFQRFLLVVEPSNITFLI